MRYVVIDFEATCDEPFNPDPQEIIEFPAVLFDPVDPDNQPEFHVFVRPVAHPRLTPFCADLTGIRQEQVDAGDPFPEVLRRFGQWLQAQGRGEVLPVTCGDWDLGSLLPRQCAQHRLGVPGWADRWANLKQLFTDHFQYAADRPGLVGMAGYLQAPLVGRLHSGIADARNIARVLRRMLERGARIANTAFWRCAGCGTENLHRARDCTQCGRPSFVLLPGDWACPRCGFGNFASREKCYDCGTPRPAGAAAPGHSQMKPGDWVCNRCGEHNFARRRNCYQCGRARR
jgi:inhibitor of KinA sporulation pathway (predicted exonuclease)